MLAVAPALLLALPLVLSVGPSPLVPGGGVVGGEADHGIDVVADHHVEAPLVSTDNNK